ncbi:alpha/beta hydrolase family esterase [Spirosoma utsteinense]|uniref:Polyhydroxybutyrate depolymerase n=1 Tax=Spirosoma utsteinense TaxID=2585773 RepID=A0ABR6W7Q4_9BACT|nr:PHB depolymerase family esterase [Spirosoma utsteinense]MBC3785824.1 polyhydroxybutyrate depolymerase [Spirosoma utsteinense]MBC3791996.1 polyhydroxybutyrate depolymerase [Spirosoma utsteinense]
MKRSMMVCLLAGLSASFARAQLVSDSLLIEGHYRVFHYNTPATLPDRSSLMFVLHGSGGTGEGMMKSTERMEQQANASRVLVVYPDGYKRYWNECRKLSPAQANLENINEQAFFDGMIRYFQKRYQIDPSRVFAAGTSGGGHMAYKLALTMPTTFRAITAIIANLPDSTNLDCQPSGKAVAMMIINGTLDPINPYQGGPVILGRNMNMGVVRSTERTLNYWAGLARYKGDPARESLPDVDPTDGKTIERYTYRQKGKPEVVLLKVIGGKHDYPNDIDVHLEALTFFMRQLTQ